MIVRPEPVLKRFAVRVLVGSPAFPAVGAVVRFFKQGATVKASVTIPNTESRIVSVYHTGVVAAGDKVQVGVDATIELSATAVDQAGATVTLLNQTGGAVTLAAGDRLVRTQQGTTPDPALVFDDPLGSTAGVSLKSVQPDSGGWVLGYVREYRFDCTVTGAGVSAVYPDLEGSWVMR